MKKKYSALIIIVGFAIVSQLIQCSTNAPPIKEKKHTIKPLTHSWDKAIPNQKAPKGFLSAKHCGMCHQKHYEEWKQSTHAQAWKDLQFQAELKKESSPFMCINCHIPLQNQQEYIVTGLIDGDIYQPVKTKNPKFDVELQQEGINCASCHVRNGKVIGPTGTDKAPHDVVKDTVHLSEQLCISCHNANAVITPTLACTFETGDEWKAGPYFGKKNCKTCHMPKTTREIMAGFGERSSRFHTFSGSGIPKFDTVKTGMLNGLEFYPPIVKKSYEISDSLSFNFKIKNEHAGHRVPTGDPERFFLIKMNILNSKNDTIIQQTDRIGEEWEWYPVAKKITDNNLNPLEERIYNLKALLKDKGKYNLIIEVTKHRLSKKNADYNKLGKHYPLFIIIFNKKYSFLMK